MADNAPPRWDPRGPEQPPPQADAWGLPLRCVRGGSWETTPARAGYKVRGGNHQSWRAPWDTFRPYAPLGSPFLARQIDLPGDLEARALARREVLLALLDSQPGQHAIPREAVAAARLDNGAGVQATLVDVDGRVLSHALDRTSVADVPGLAELFAVPGRDWLLLVERHISLLAAREPAA